MIRHLLWSNRPMYLPTQHGWWQLRTVWTGFLWVRFGGNSWWLQGLSMSRPRRVCSTLEWWGSLYWLPGGLHRSVYFLDLLLYISCTYHIFSSSKSPSLKTKFLKGMESGAKKNVHPDILNYRITFFPYILVDIPVVWRSLSTVMRFKTDDDDDDDVDDAWWWWWYRKKLIYDSTCAAWICYQPLFLCCQVTVVRCVQMVTMVTQKGGTDHAAHASRVPATLTLTQMLLETATGNTNGNYVS